MEEKVKYEFEPDYTVLSGETILEVIKEIHMPLDALAFKTGINYGRLLNIVYGGYKIEARDAEKLENILGIEKSFWLNLDRNHRQFKTE